jgi:CubicO group peptidase (beta-lactamase class C family)
MKRYISVSLFLLLLLPSFSQPITSVEIDRLVERTLTTFNVPGIAVGIVKDGHLIHSKGYGVRSINTMTKMDDNTLFAIASNSKAFTSAALAILIDQGKLRWDSKVIDIIPEFRLYNSYVTEDFTIADLLTHRSGMGLGAGDLMLWPDSTKFTKEEIIHNLRYLPQVSSFRTKYDYDNLLYVVAGEVVARVTGMSWEEFTETNIMEPLGMNMSAASFSRLKDRSNIIDAHVPIDGKLQVVPKQEGKMHNSAGGIYSNITDMSKWVIMQMNGGKYGEELENQLFSRERQNEMWTIHTVIPVRNGSIYNTHFAGYGLGWNLSDVKGYLQASHTGGLMGIVTQVTMIPELQLGIIVFTNQQEGAAFTAITNTIKDSYFGIKGIDRVKEQYDRVIRNQTEAKKITDEIWAKIEEQQSNSSLTVNPDIYTGTYNDIWFGDVTISYADGRMYFSSVKSPKMKGEMLFYSGNTFIVKWNDRSLDADAFAVFSLDKDGRAAGITMEAVSPLTDFSFDFQDLNLRRRDLKE